MAPRYGFKKPSDIRVAVIGYGGAFNMGRQHLHLARKAGMQPAAVVEIDSQRLEVAQEDFPGIGTFTSLAAMLKAQVADLVINITPHNAHYKLAAQCLRGGCHVVNEKPFVVKTRDADALIKLAKQLRKVVTAYHNRHWDGWIMRAKREVVDKGRIGEVRRIEAHMGGYRMPKDWWRSSLPMSGGLLYDWGVHLVEYALQIAASPMVEVSGFKTTDFWSQKMKSSSPRKHDCVEDDAVAMIRFESGAFMNMSMTNIWSREESPYKMTIHGTKGSYAFGPKVGWRTMIAGRDNKLVVKEGANPANKHGLFYTNIAEHLCGKAELIITPEYARRPIHAIDLAMRSADQNKALRVTYG